MTITSPLEGGRVASNEHQTMAAPVVEGTVPADADFLFDASIFAPGKKSLCGTGGDDAVKAKTDRKVFVYLPHMRGGNEFYIEWR